MPRQVRPARDMEMPDSPRMDEQGAIRDDSRNDGTAHVSAACFWKSDSACAVKMNTFVFEVPVGLIEPSKPSKIAEIAKTKTVKESPLKV